MIKLIATDLDGTLLNSEGKISLANEKALKRAINKGVKVVLATGRPIFSADVFLKQLDNIKEDAYTICFNGSLLVNNKTKEVLYSSSILGKDVKRAFELSKKLNTGFFIYSLDQICLYEQMTDCVQFEIDLVSAKGKQVKVNDFTDDEKFIKMTFTAPKEVLDSIEEEVFKVFSSTHTVVRSHDVFLEVLAKTSSKGKALDFLLNSLNINKDEVLSFGDNNNDYDLIKVAKYGIVMENSPSQKLKEIAYEIAPSNDKDGVSHILDKYL